MIPTKFHAIVDYFYGILTIFVPWIFGFGSQTISTYALLIAGGLAIVMSLFTAYEGGVIKIIPMRAHLIIDILMGIGLAISPWLFTFSDTIFLPHLILGMLTILTGLLTKSTPTNKTLPKAVTNLNILI